MKPKHSPKEPFRTSAKQHIKPKELEVIQLRDKQIKEILEFNSPFPIDKAGLITQARQLCALSIYEIKNNL